MESLKAEEIADKIHESQKIMEIELDVLLPQGDTTQGHSTNSPGHTSQNLRTSNTFGDGGQGLSKQE